MNTTQSQQYLNQQIMTASPAMLVFMLYDKAISCLKEAIRAIEAGQVEARWKANGRAMEIISHLRMTLNMDAGGEIARNLDSIYATLLLELPRVDLKSDSEAAEKAIRLLEPLRDSWRALAAKGEETARQAAHAAAQVKTSAVPVTKPVPPHPSSSRILQAPNSPPSGIKISA